MDAAVALREQVDRGEEAKVSFNDLVVKACAKALTRFPMVNASWAGDKIVTHAEVHVGVAVAIPDGLITPVVRNADRKSSWRSRARCKDLAAARARPQAQARGVHGLDLHHLEPRHVRRHGVHRHHQPARERDPGRGRGAQGAGGGGDDQLAVGQRMKVTLSCDHRVVDGALAAQFLAEVRRLLESRQPAAVVRSGAQSRASRSRRGERPPRLRSRAALESRPLTRGCLRRGSRRPRHSMRGAVRLPSAWNFTPKPGRQAVHRVLLARVDPATRLRHDVAPAGADDAAHVSCGRQVGSASVTPGSPRAAAQVVVRDVGAEHVDVHEERGADAAVRRSRGAQRRTNGTLDPASAAAARSTHRGHADW